MTLAEKFLKTFIISIFCITVFEVKAYSQEKIEGFYLANYKDDGGQDWEVKGKEAFIHDNYVDINMMDAKYFIENDTVSVKSKKAQLDKENMDVKLKDDVHVENKAGMTLDTESLNWKKDESRVETEDWVEISNNSMNIKAKGMTGNSELKKVDFHDNVAVKLPDEKNKRYILITCSGPLEIDYNSGTGVFNNDVVVENREGTLFSDKATVYFDTQNKNILKVISENNVKIIKDDNVTVADKATYLAKEQKLILEGSPRLIYFPEGQNFPGEKN